MEIGIWILVIIANIAMIGQGIFFYRRGQYANAIFCVVALIIFWIGFIYSRGANNGTI